MKRQPTDQNRTTLLRRFQGSHLADHLIGQVESAVSVLISMLFEGNANKLASRADAGFREQLLHAILHRAFRNGHSARYFLFVTAGHTLGRGERKVLHDIQRLVCSPKSVL